MEKYLPGFPLYIQYISGP